MAAGLTSAAYFHWERNAEDPQGGSSPWCDDFEDASVPNGKGMTVSMHTTACTTLGTDIGTYVHVLRENEVRSRSSLAFRFAPHQPFEPRIEWVSPTVVHIAVDRVSQVSKQSSAKNGVRIEYSIGAEDYPPSLEAAKVRANAEKNN